MQRNDLFRNRFHFCSPEGWINDPNGFSYYAGRYHLFFQHNPYGTTWGPMHWGHAVSTDLVRWSVLPVALAPDRPYDKDGCFSGTAAQDGDHHVLMYTGNRLLGPDGSSVPARQTQCVAIGDGEHYRKLETNPVIGSDLLPDGCPPADFRDPKLWREGDVWYCLVAAREEHDGGRLLLFTASDLEHWSFVGVVASGAGRLGSMWECPDFFGLAGSDVLVWSPQFVPRAGCRYQNIHSSVYSLGRLDRETGAFRGSAPAELDFGPDFYAPQTLRSPDGRRILIAWMQMWERTIPTDELRHGWAGAMTLPRELDIEEGELVQRPVRELEDYRTAPARIDARIGDTLPWEGARGHSLDIEIVLTPHGAREVGIIVKQGVNTETRIAYRPAGRRLVLDRSRSGHAVASTTQDRPDCSTYCCELPRGGDSVALRIVLDRSSCEVFADGGRRALTATLYAPEGSARTSFFAVGGEAEVHGTAWKLEAPGEDAT